jgi:hypothetical protein
MKSRFALAVTAAAFLGCAHAKTTDAQRTEEKQEEKQDETQEQKQSEAKGGKGDQKKAGSAREGARRDTDADKRAERPAAADEVPVPNTAAGLLSPGADDKIREKLSERGFTGGGDKNKVSTEEALRRFQRDKELPATGMPDHATVRALGLDPDDVFRRASPSGEGSGGEGVKK